MTPKVVVLPPARAVDPAGLDKLLLAIGEAGARWVQRRAASYGFQVDVWNGDNGLRRVVEEAIVEHGVPNKRFGELVTPRSIAERIGAIASKRAKRRRVGA